MTLPLHMSEDKTPIQRNGNQRPVRMNINYIDCSHNNCYGDECQPNKWKANKGSGFNLTFSASLIQLFT